MEDTNFKNGWTLYYHPSREKRWTIDSFEKISFFILPINLTSLSSYLIVSHILKKSACDNTHLALQVSDKLLSTFQIYQTSSILNVNICRKK